MLRTIINKVLDFEVALTSSLNRELKINIVLARTRKFPYWRRGHILILQDALSAKNIGAAYGAAQCISSLSRGDWQKAEASHLLSRVFLAAGDVARAYQLIKDFKSEYAECAAFQEDLAACLMAMEKDQEAQKILVNLGREKLSPEGRAVLSYLDKKLSDKLYN